MKTSDILKHCFNPKVIIGLVLLIAVLFIFTPLKSQVLGYAPLLLALACPLSMIFMMKGMKNHQKDDSKK